jgi:hypothetical protein
MMKKRICRLFIIFSTFVIMFTFYSSTRIKASEQGAQSSSVRETITQQVDLDAKQAASKEKTVRDYIWTEVKSFSYNDFGWNRFERLAISYKFSEIKEASAYTIEDYKPQFNFTVYGPSKPEWSAPVNALARNGAGISETTAPLIIGKGNLIQEPLNQFGHGSKSALDRTKSASIISNTKFYKATNANGEKVFKIVYEITNNPAISDKSQMFDYHLKVEEIMFGGSNGRINIETKVTNLMDTPINDFVLGSRYDTDIEGSESSVPLPVQYIGEKRGIYFLKENFRGDASIKLNFLFNKKGGPDNWSVRQNYGIGQVSKFYDPAYTAFNSSGSTGLEALAGDNYNEVAYDKTQVPNSEKYDTAVYMKNQPINLGPGETTSYNFDVGLTVLVNNALSISLDESLVEYDGGSHTVTGTLIDSTGADKLEKIFCKIDDGPFKEVQLVKSKLQGMEYTWSCDIPESELTPAKTRILTFYAKNDGTPEKQSAQVTQKLVYNNPPELTVDKSANWFVPGTDYSVNGTFKDIDTEDTMLTMMYSLDGTNEKVLGTEANREPLDTAKTFIKTIPADELGSGSHLLKIWLQDNRGKVSNIETYTIAPHNNPELSAELMIGNEEITEGERTTFTSTFKNKAKSPSVYRNVTYSTVVPLVENVTFDLSSVKLNGKLISPTAVQFTNGILKIGLDQLEPNQEYSLTYDLVSAISNPPLSKPVELKQAYTLTGDSAERNGITIVSNNGVQNSLKIIPRLAKVKVSFVDEKNESIVEDALFDATVSERIDLSKNETIVKRLLEVKSKNYILDTPPEDEKDLLITATGVERKYTFRGTLFIESAPKEIDFGEQKVSAFNKVFDNPTFDSPLVIWDNRATLGRWKIKLKQSDDLSIPGDSTSKLPNALYYKTSSEEKMISTEAQEVFLSQHQLSGKYDVSGTTWGPKKQGLRLNVPVGAVKQVGKYETTLTWQLEEAY